ncbi:energy transducer TonB [Undibacterium sp. RuTC16W]|uniref:energy transducer TonB n=1 Tax=Undibacterium sp. RuTC16W TaxID=3413048 RepID=UPI003BF0F14B
MEFSISGKKKPTSISGVLVVSLLHLLLLGGLLYGLRPPAGFSRIDPDFVYVEPTKPEPLPEPKELLPRPVLKNPLIPVVVPPDVIVSHEPAPSITVVQRTEFSPQDDGNRTGPVEMLKAKADLVPVFIGAVVEAKSCEKPEYPRNALRNEYTGTVTLALLVGIDGRVVDARVEQSSGYKELDQAARAGLSLCKFKPASLNGQAQKSWSKIQYVWSLSS